MLTTLQTSTWPNGWVRRATALVVAVGVLATGLVAPGEARATGGNGLRAAANEYRVAGGLEPVGGTDLLNNISVHRANQMVDANRLEHDMAYVRERLDRAGVCWTAYGEIIAWSRGYSDYSAERTMLQWWNSPTHHAIVMTPGYNYAGGAWAAHADGGNYSVMVFATLCGSDATTTSSLGMKAYDPDRPMVLAAGTHVGYKLSSTGDVQQRKYVTFSSRYSGSAAGRTTADGKAYILVSSGPLQGYWVRESARQYVRGTTYKKTYRSAQRLLFDAGTYTGYRFDKLGRKIAHRTGTLARRSGADTTARAIINGRAYFYVANGIWAGYWVRDTVHVTRVR
jgi:hypothetical protein